MALVGALRTFGAPAPLTFGVRAHNRHMGSFWTFPALVLAAAFFPLAVAVALRLYPSLRPPKHRPVTFVVGGVFLLSLGALAAYTLRSTMESGVFHLSSRRFGVFHAEASHQTFEYWALVLTFYGICVFLSGVGVASIGLCIRRPPGNEP